MIDNTGRRRISVLLFLCVAATYALFAQGTVRSWDGATMLAVTRSIVVDHSFAVTSQHVAKQAPDGRYYSMFGIGQSIAVLPLFVAGQLAASLISDATLSDDLVIESVVSWFNPILTALTCALLYLVAIEVGLSPAVAAVCAVIYAFATAAFVQMKDFNGEPLTAVLLLLGVYTLVRARTARSLRVPVIIGICAGAIITVRISSVVVVPVLALGIAWLAMEDGNRRRLVRWLAAFSIPVVLALGVVGLYNYVRFASIWETGYPAGVFVYRFLWGLDVQFLSPESGLFWYNPILLLFPLGIALVYRRHPQAAAIFVLLFIAHRIVYSLIGFPDGRHSAGNRYIVVTMPYLILFVGAVIQNYRTRGWRLVIGGFVAVSILVQLPIVYTNPSYYFARRTSQHQWEQQQDSEHFAREVGKRSRRWRDSLLVQSWPIAAEVTGNVLQRGQWLRSLDERTHHGDDATALLATRSFRVPYFWWVLAYYYGAPGWAIGLLVTFLLVANGIGVVILYRSWPKGEGINATIGDNAGLQ